MSQTAAMRTFGTCASDFMSARQRPPVPIRPTLSVSLAPRAFAAGAPNAASPAAAPAEDFRNDRRDGSRGGVIVGESRRVVPATGVGERFGADSGAEYPAVGRSTTDR